MSEPTGSPPDQTPPRPEGEGGGVAGYVREAWSQALVAVNDASDEVQKIVGKVASWVELGPEEARRLATELAERLRHERDELEGTVETAVRRALGPFRLPTKDEVAALEARLDALSARLDRLAERRKTS